jgi:hypothetical protein
MSEVFMIPTIQGILHVKEISNETTVLMNNHIHNGKAKRFDIEIQGQIESVFKFPNLPSCIRPNQNLECYFQIITH